ncbi:lectin C-type domain protein [Teladorsagia circumcincta]|uniref:Lectin C-type domain protein n=1 Tax=Teladorsagia circumcincta TaxID=45464 RepID=A0A2G9V449_TELCI|nr:lectin C-type domain protein [Teladorsagia circumcincta]
MIAVVVAVVVASHWLWSVEAAIVTAEHIGKIVTGGEKYKHVMDFQAECARRNGELASIHSKEENDFIYDLVDKALFGDDRSEHGNYVHLGMRNGQWLDGTKLDFTKWGSKDELDCSGNEDDFCAVRPVVQRRHRDDIVGDLEGDHEYESTIFMGRKEKETFEYGEDQYQTVKKNYWCHGNCAPEPSSRNVAVCQQREEFC